MKNKCLECNGKETPLLKLYGGFCKRCIQNNIKEYEKDVESEFSLLRRTKKDKVSSLKREKKEKKMYMREENNSHKRNIEQIKNEYNYGVDRINQDYDQDVMMIKRALKSFFERKNEFKKLLVLSSK